MSRAQSGKHSPQLRDDSAVVVGLIKGSSGLRGELKVELHTGSPHRFAPGSILYLLGRPARVLNARESRAGLVVKLDTVDDRTQADSLRGAYLTVPQNEIEPLPLGSYYHFQIVGIGVWTEAGEYLGEVKEIMLTGSNDVYIVGAEGKRNVLIPAMADAIIEVSTPDNRMVVRLPEGLPNYG